MESFPKYNIIPGYFSPAGIFALGNLLFLLGGLLIMGLLIVFALKFHRLIRRNKIMQKDIRRLQDELNNVQLEAIQYKMNPHLFKNTLNAIQSHAYQTYYTLDKLSGVLDYILYESDHQYVTLEEEIDFALNLIEINRLKLSPLFELNVKKRVQENDPLYHQKLIAPLVSIDLIENAFKHADLQGADAFISIIFELKDNKFLLTVSNKISNRPLLKKSRSGFGQESFKKRLDVIYGENYKLDRFVENNIYIAHLKIDLFEHKVKMLAIGR